MKRRLVKKQLKGWRLSAVLKLGSNASALYVRGRKARLIYQSSPSSRLTLVAEGERSGSLVATGLLMHFAMKGVRHQRLLRVIFKDLPETRDHEWIEKLREALVKAREMSASDVEGVAGAIEDHKNYTGPFAALDPNPVPA